jgi:hypothetical protein
MNYASRKDAQSAKVKGVFQLIVFAGLPSRSAALRAGLGER